MFSKSFFICLCNFFRRSSELKKSLIRKPEKCCFYDRSLNPHTSLVCVCGCGGCEDSFLIIFKVMGFVKLLFGCISTIQPSLATSIIIKVLAFFLVSPNSSFLNESYDSALRYMVWIFGTFVL